MIVRAVHVHQPFAQRAEHLQRGRRPIDELPVRARERERALEHELFVFARFKSVLFEKTLQSPAQLGHVEHRFDRATVRAAANECAIRALAQHEIERADDDGFARAGLARDRVAAGLKFERQIGDQRQVFDPQRREHGQ